MNSQNASQPITTFTSQEVANLLRVSIQKVERWRKAKTGPTFIQVGREYRYPASELVEWLARHIIVTN